LVGSKAHSYATESRHKSAALLEMAAPPHFNPDVSLLPDVKASIGGVPGGGGQTTFLKDILIALKGSTIQYKNPNDTDPKSYMVKEILVAEEKPKEQEPKETEQKQGEQKEEEKQTKNLDLESVKNAAFEQIGALKIKSETKKVIKSAVAKTENIDDINGLLAALKKINDKKVPLIDVAAAVAKESGHKENIIKVIIKELDK